MLDEVGISRHCDMRTYGDGVDGLADNALVGCVGVGSRHFDGLGGGLLV